MLQTLLLFVDLQWIVLYWSGKSIIKNNKYNEYNYNPEAIKFQCIFALLLFTVHAIDGFIQNTMKVRLQSIYSDAVVYELKKDKNEDNINWKKF